MFIVALYATPLGQRPLSVLSCGLSVWASARMLQLEPWFRSWVPSCVFSAGGGPSSVEAWYTTAIDIEEVLSGVVQGDVHVFVADVVKSFDTVDRAILDRVLSSLGLPGWFRHAYFEYHSLVWLRFKLSAGLSIEYDVHCCVVFALVSLSVCPGWGSASVIC